VECNSKLNTISSHKFHSIIYQKPLKLSNLLLKNTILALKQIALCEIMVFLFIQNKINLLFFNHSKKSVSYTQFILIKLSFFFNQKKYNNTNFNIEFENEIILLLIKMRIEEELNYC
jgi:hypothetical protein